MKTAIITKRIIESAKTFYDSKQTSNHRYYSWDYCYEAFCYARRKNRNDIDLLSLHLGFYLASWGMFRGSSFLLDKTFTVHKPMVEEILEPKYDVLWKSGEDCSLLLDKMDVLFELEAILKRYYGQFRDKNAKCEVSQTLITKILLGTLGCVPAYDRCFKAAVRTTGVTTGIFNEGSICKLVEFYRTNKRIFESARKRMSTANEGIPYPQMKLLDMAFWQIGLDKEKEDKKAKGK